MQSLSHQFLTWCRSKPADEAYDYGDNCACAFAQFLNATGMAIEPCVGNTVWCDLALDEPVDHPMPEGIDDAVDSPACSFGALADRLAEQVSA